MTRFGWSLLVMALAAALPMVATASTPAAADGAGDPSAPAVVRGLAAGDAFTCAIRNRGAVKCWGDGDFGALGLGSTADRGESPGELGDALPKVALGPGRSAVAISAGEGHVCALLDNATVKCWGQNGNGQLGLGDTANRGDGPGEMGASLPAVDLGPGRTATAVSVEGNHSCALLDDATVKCWGANASGELGLGDGSDRGDGPGEMGASLPTVDLGTGRTALAIAAGYDFTCALLDDDSVKCWGANHSGQLGLGNTASRGIGPGEMGNALPVVDLGSTGTVTSIGVGISHACAVFDDGRLKCWGANFTGQLGLGNTATRGDGPGEMGDALPAVDLGPGLEAIGVSGGEGHTCAVLSNSRVKCWGWNDDGQLGQGHTGEYGDGPLEMGTNLPAIDVGPLVGSDAVVAGRYHSCAAGFAGWVKCWGNGAGGRLGQGDQTFRGDQAGEMGIDLPFIELGEDPSVTITTPPTGASYAVGAVVNADFSCSDEVGGSGIASCVGTVADGSPIDTTTPGAKSFTVTAVDGAGNDTVVTRSYTVQGAPDTTDPIVTITTPPSGATYEEDQVVNADFSCNDEVGGSGIASCLGTVANGSPIDTATPGSKTFTVTGTDLAGNDAVVTRSYTVEPATADTTDPAVTVTTPPAGATYERDQVVNADFSCSDEVGGSGIASCVGTVADGSPIDTATLGAKSFTVTGTDAAGNDTVVTRNYSVVDVTDPTVSITNPPPDTLVARNQVVNAAFSCGDESGGSGIASCVGSVANGSAIDTATLGVKSVTVTATDVAGNETVATREYTVVRAVGRQPDARIRTGAVPYAGDDVYNTSGAGQAVSVRPARSVRTVTFTVSIQNEGTLGAEQFRLQGQRSQASFTVRYQAGPTNITAGVTAGTYLTPSVAQGGTFVVTVRVTMAANTPGTAALSRLLTATSTNDPTRRDAVKFTTRR